MNDHMTAWSAGADGSLFRDAGEYRLSMALYRGWLWRLVTQGDRLVTHVLTRYGGGPFTPDRAEELFMEDLTS